MSTNSTIAVQLDNGSIKQVYCHWDGYLDHNGKLLVENYNSQELAESLVELGNISSLDRVITPAGLHSYKSPENGVTVFYARDRGDDFIEPETFVDYNDYINRGTSQEYNYLFRNGCWECAYDEHVVIVSDALNDA